MSSVSESAAGAAYGEERRAFEYRPVPVLVPVAAFFAFTGLLGFLTVAGLPIALIGLFLAAVALLKIVTSGGEYGGRGLAAGALALAAVGFVGGSAAQAFAYATEVPEGYRRINFTEDVAAKGLVFTPQGVAAHPDLAALDGKKVFLKGYMYPTQQTVGLKSFVFCRDSGDCCFGGQPKIEDMILVKMTGGATADFAQGLVSVAGTFKIIPDGLRGVQEGNLTPVFEITAIEAEPSRSSF